MSKIALFLIFICLMSCREINKAKSAREVFVKSLMMNIPSNAKLIEGQGTDSYVMYLIAEEKDTLILQYGKIGVINNLHYISPPVFPLSQKQSVSERAGKVLSQDEVLFSETPEEDREQKIFDENYFMYDTINDIVVKVVQPKRIGNGITGLYIPKLKDGNSFSIYGANLDSSTHIAMLEMFRTIRYK